MNVVVSRFRKKKVHVRSFSTVLFIFFFAQFYKAQSVLDLYSNWDTLKAGFKGSGELNKVDLLPPFAMSSFSFTTNSQFLFSPFQFANSAARVTGLNQMRPMRYTSLPHVSFAYAFGSSGFQFAKVQYSQAFTKGLVLNLDFSNNQSAGILRNSGFQDRDVLLRISKKTKKVHSLFSAQFENRTLEWNGGITNDSLPLDFSLDLIPVFKSDAKSVNKEVKMRLLNKLALKKDSLQDFGLYFSNAFLSQNRVYTETGNLTSMYSMINFDSAETRDHLQISTVENELGTYWNSGKWKTNVGVNQRFWNFRNNQLYRDTLEIGFVEAIGFNSKAIRLNQEFEYYFVGKSSSWKNRINAKFDAGRWTFSANWAIENSLPELIQRHYSANNLYYQLQQYQLQFKNTIGFTTNYRVGKQTVGFKAAYLLFKNPYFFDGQIWTNDLYSLLQIVKLDCAIDFNWKRFTFTPVYSLLLQPVNLMVYPTHIMKARIGLKGGVLKNKKLNSFIGIEPQWIGAFQRISLLPVLDVFSVNQLTEKQSGFFDLAFYTGFEVKGFRFFARAENIGYFWNNRMIQTVKGYPIPPMQIRLGITWDFWN
jgi:hypothetical protein